MSRRFFTPGPRRLRVLPGQSEDPNSHAARMDERDRWCGMAPEEDELLALELAERDRLDERGDAA